MPYPTIADVKAGYLPADTELTDGEIQDMIDLAVYSAEQCCGQSFIPQTKSLIVDGSGRNVQPLRAPLRSVTQIEFRCCGDTWETITYGDLRIGGSRKMLAAGNVTTLSQRVALGLGRHQRFYTAGCGLQSAGLDCGQCVFPAGFQNIRITGEWGRWADVPLDIKDAIGRLVEYAGSCDNPKGAVSHPYSDESVPGGRDYTMRQILRNVNTDRMTGYADVDAVFARYPATFGATTVL